MFKIGDLLAFKGCLEQKRYYTYDDEGRATSHSIEDVTSIMVVDVCGSNFITCIIMHANGVIRKPFLSWDAVYKI